MKTPLMSIRLAALVLAGLLAVAARAGAADAADKAAVARGPSHEPEPLAYDPAMLATVPRELLTDHEACYLVARDVHELLPDGTARITHHSIARVNARGALEALGDWPLPYDASCEQFVLNVARVHKADGRIVEAAPEDVHVRDENTDFFEFDDYKNVIVSFSQLAVGDVVEVKYTRHLTDPQFPGQYFSSFMFYHEDYPIHLSELDVCLPSGKTLKHETCAAKVEPEVATKDGVTTYRWRMENVPPCPVEDDLPHDNGYGPFVDFSTFATWEDVARATAALKADRQTCTAEMRAKVESLTRGLTGPRDKLRALARWCRDEVRYLSIHHGAFGFRPHKPEEVFAKRYGNCNDVCQLLYVMLREAGIEAEFVLLNTDAEVQLSHAVPSPMAEHVVLLVEVDGRQHWLDPTATWSAWDRLRGDLHGRKACALKGDKVRLLETPPRTPEMFHVEQESQVDLAIAGHADWRVARTCSGEAAENWRSHLTALPPARRKGDLFEDYLLHFPQARLADRRRLEANLNQVDEPLQLKLGFRLPDAVLEDSDGPLLDVASPLVHHYFSLTVDVTRERPLRVDAREIVDRMVVRLPVVYELTYLSEDARVESKWGSVEFTATADDEGSTITYVWRARLNQSRVQVEELPEFSKFLGKALDLSYATVWFDFPEQLGEQRLADFRRELNRRPLDVKAAAVIIDALRYSDELELAADAVKKALEAAPDARAIWEHKAGITRPESERSKVLEELVRRWPEEPEYRLLLAKSLLDQKRYEEAARTADEVLAHAPEELHAQALVLGARAHFGHERHAEAARKIAAAREADALEEHSDELAILEGEMALHGGKLALARRRFDEALEINPDHVEALAGAIRVALAEGDKPAARHLLRHLVSLAEDEREHLATAARLCLESERPDDAADLAETALDHDPADGDAAAVLIEARHLKKDYRGVLAVPGRQKIDSPEALAALLDSSLALGDRKTAAEIARKARAVAKGAASKPGIAALRKQLQRYDAHPPR